MPIDFALNAALDRRALAARFASVGSVRIAPFLGEKAAIALRDHLRDRTDWYTLIGGEDRVYEIDRETRAGFTNERIAALDEAVHASARHGFQFRFDSIRVPDDRKERARRDDPLTRFARWMDTDEVLSMFRQVTGEAAIRFADAQATSYAAGDFLTAHDDAVAGKGRRAAYVLGLTPGWRLEWGGLLTFHDPRSDRFSGTVPGFNTLDLFRVPQVHSVSLVGPSADGSRLSVTGWLREEIG